ncbi:serine O-acetyltransferase [Methylomonas sp. MgM2]
MIKSRADYLYYIEADRVSLNCEKTLKNYLFNDIWRFQRLLRKTEYLTNCNCNKFLRAFAKYRLVKLSVKLGFTIPINVFGPGLSIAHRGTIVVNKGVRVGANCRIHVCVNIGAQAGRPEQVPVIGDNCYIGPGAKIFGAIRLANDISIGANAVVNKSFEEPGVTVAGIPAKIISNSGSQDLHIKGAKL